MATGSYDLIGGVGGGFRKKISRLNNLIHLLLLKQIPSCWSVYDTQLGSNGYGANIYS